NGLSPLLCAMTPADVNKPHLISSRRVTCLCDSALRISQRFLRAFSASRTRALDAFLERKIDIFSSCLDCQLETSPPCAGRFASDERPLLVCEPPLATVR